MVRPPVGGRKFLVIFDRNPRFSKQFSQLRALKLKKFACGARSKFVFVENNMFNSSSPTTTIMTMYNGLVLYLLFEVMTPLGMALRAITKIRHELQRYFMEI